MSKPIDLKMIKHPWQPDWVRTGDDLRAFLNLLDEHLHLSENKMDWYPPWLVCFAGDEDGKNQTTFLKSKWFGKYDPYEYDLPDPLTVIAQNGKAVHDG